MHKIHLFTAEATGQQERWGWNGLSTQEEMTSTNLLFEVLRGIAQKNDHW